MANVPMVNVPVRRIESLLCLADESTFHRAATRLGISQLAVSAHIRRFILNLRSGGKP